MRKTRRTKIAVALFTTVAVGAALGGCTHGAKVSPSAAGYGWSGTEINNGQAITWDTNLRAFLEDLGRATYLDKPSRLSPRTIPY